MKETLAVSDTQKKSTRQLLRALCYTCLGLVLPAVCLIGFLTYITRPPRDSEAIATFHAHRRAFERLRDMLHNDPEVIRVNYQGVSTAGPDNAEPDSSEGRFPRARYKEYLSALKKAGGEAVMQDDDRIGVLIRGSGFAGDTVHLEICRRETEPINQVPSIEAFHKAHRPGETADRRIEGNWYHWADW